MRTCHGFVLGDNLTCSGGSAKKAFAYLSRMDGPIEDVLLPYDADELVTCTEYRADEFCFNQMRLFPDDHDVVKQAILDYGAIYTNMCYEGGYFNSTDNTYYFDGDLPTDHAVLLCGWDDNKLTAGGTGAWIIKNSWGDDWGESGFFYISYNDTKLLSTVGAYPGYTRITSGDTIYMYNELGSISNTGYGAETAYGLVKFITGGENEINRLGTYTNTEGTTVSFEVYDDKSGNTLSNLLTSIGPFTCDFPGYHSFEIPTPILLVVDEDFYVKVQYNTPGYTYPIPFERFSDGYADPQIESGVCWISSTGSSWTAYGNDVEGKERDLTIRAYAHDMNVSAVSIINKNDFIVYPQPANDVVFVEFENDEYKTIEVLDIKGSLVLKADCNSTIFEISNHKLVSGYYLIKVSTDKNVKTKQLIVY
jgi:C1A family cysteine protease